MVLFNLPYTSVFPVPRDNLNHCPFCGKYFYGSRARLNNKEHVEAVHLRLKKHSCTFCGKKFSWSCNVITHHKRCKARLKALGLTLVWLVCLTRIYFLCRVFFIRELTYRIYKTIVWSLNIVPNFCIFCLSMIRVVRMYEVPTIQKILFCKSIPGRQYSSLRPVQFDTVLPVPEYMWTSLIADTICRKQNTSNQKINKIWDI